MVGDRAHAAPHEDVFRLERGQLVRLDEADVRDELHPLANRHLRSILEVVTRIV